MIGSGDVLYHMTHIERSTASSSVASADAWPCSTVCAARLRKLVVTIARRGPAESHRPASSRR
jgi:hypothetical protein